MEVLASSVPSSNSLMPRIQNARSALSLLATINESHDQKRKEDVLSELCELLREDAATDASSAEGLIDLINNLMEKLDRNSIQKDTLAVQIKITEAYGLAIDLVLRHYAADHLSGIIEELKTDLIQTANSLRNLNRHCDPDLSFAIDYALEGIERLQSDRNELIRVLKKVGQIIVLGAEVCNRDIPGTLESLEKIVSDLDFNYKSAWYDAGYALDGLARQFEANDKEIRGLDIIYQKKEKSSRLTYLYIDTLAHLAFHGKNEEMRQHAYDRMMTFKNCSQFGIKFTILEAIKHFEKPKIFDKNQVIQKRLYQYLTVLATQSKDEKICTEARVALCARIVFENQKIERSKNRKSEEAEKWLKLLFTVVPKDKQAQEMWVYKKRQPA